MRESNPLASTAHSLPKRPSGVELRLDGSVSLAVVSSAYQGDVTALRGQSSRSSSVTAEIGRSVSGTLMPRPAGSSGRVRNWGPASDEVSEAFHRLLHARLMKGLKLGFPSPSACTSREARYRSRVSDPPGAPTIWCLPAAGAKAKLTFPQTPLGYSFAGRGGTRKCLFGMGF